MRKVAALLLASSLASWAAPAPAKLAIIQTVLHDRREDAPAISARYEYVAGEPLYLSYRVSGYTVKNDAVDLRWQMYMTDPDGLLLAPLSNGAVREDVSSNDKDWLPKVEQTIPLPPQLNGGKYAIHLRIADEVSKQTAEEIVPFNVRGRAKESLPGIVVRGLRFYAGEDDPIAIEPPVYAPGAAVWVRFEIAGYQIGESNAFDVEYGVAVYRPSGKLLYEQPVAADEKESPFYPKRWLQGGFNLNLSADLPPGTYGVKVKVRDKRAGATVEAAANFEVKR